MKIKKKYISWHTGFIRFKNDFEINWDLRDIALPLSLQFYKYAVFVRVLTVSFIFARKSKTNLK